MQTRSSTYYYVSPTEFVERTHQVNHELTKRDAKTFGTLARKEERLQRFLDNENKQYEAQLFVERARDNASHRYELRTRKAVASILVTMRNAPTHSYNLRSRN